MNPDDVVVEIEALYHERGSEPYGEAVTLFEHSLLTAATAQDSGAEPSLVVAALLHDVGHLLDEPDDEFGKHTHDVIGGAWLAERFPEAVSEPVRLHVDAKRYLCGVDPGYHDELSPASQYTLTKQGGPMGADERATFESEAFAAAAVQLRRWEDAFAKQPVGEVPRFERFRPLIEDQLTQRQAPSSGG